MPAPKLSITLRNSGKVIDRLQRMKDESETLESKYQHFISEMIMLRLFSIFEEGVSEIAFKLAAGAVYSNGLSPALTTQATSIGASRGLFLNFGRARPVQNLKWTKAVYIKESVQHILPVTERFVINAQSHGQIINEMRTVRNVLAHGTSSAKRDYKNTIRSKYGANPSIMPGAFLCSTKRQKPCNLNYYMPIVRIIMTDLASGI
jgi:hypothetical protein